jgi:hypothetical protein
MLREIAHATRRGLLIFGARLSLSIFSLCVPPSEAFAKFSQHRQSRAKNFRRMPSHTAFLRSTG